jgi:2-C-methyl-D-erythritol 4-phosphate cytidylyltransferase
MRNKQYVLIPAGGSGSRMGSHVPKQFIPVVGKPVLVYTIEAFIRANPETEFVLVLPKEHFNTWEVIKKEFLPAQNIKIVEGGATRFNSVKNGLSLLPGTGTVAIHDAVRPFVSKRLIDDCFTAAEKHGCAIAAIEPKDSLFEMKDGQPFSRNRTAYRLAQTPQCFSLKEIKQAFNQPYNAAFTDDASVFEANGGKLHLVEGEYDNFKITTPEDLIIAEYLIKGINTDLL